MFPIRTLMTAAALLGLAGQADAQSTPGVALSLEELGELRGGYMTAQGVRFDFGATVRTYVDGSLALESRLMWTADGARTQHSGGADALPVQVDLAGLGFGDLTGGRAVVLGGQDGATALIHALDGQGLRGVIVNSADGLDLRQEIEIDLTLPDLNLMQDAAGQARLGAQLNQDLNAAILRAAGG